MPIRDLGFIYLSGHGMGLGRLSMPVLDRSTAETDTQTARESAAIVVDACRGIPVVADVAQAVPPVKPKPTSISPEARALAGKIMSVIGADQNAKHQGGANVRDVVDALGHAAAVLFSDYAQNLRPGTNLVEALKRVVEREARELAEPGSGARDDASH